MGTSSVSYTHLDVYKRQTVHREEVTALDESVPVLVASGPLTEGVLAALFWRTRQLRRFVPVGFVCAVAAVMLGSTMQRDVRCV